ncbi:MAG: carbonic anhydrase family protein [Chitinophagales bacterium]|jgi:carbonic anhydrase|nr:carbonic anhydrase family protein [Chitinophagales bacterium]
MRNSKLDYKDITPEIIIDALKKGNHRFVKNITEQKDLIQQRSETKDDQKPYVAILSCMDSRASTELIFDQGLGDIFAIRVAGNVVNTDILASLEYATKVVGVKLIIVLGHTKCGAIKAACDHVELGNITELLSKIQPAVYEERTETNIDARNSKNSEFVENVSKINVNRSVQAIIQRSYIIEELIKQKQVGILGAMYNIQTGEVEFYDESNLYPTFKVV